MRRGWSAFKAKPDLQLATEPDLQLATEPDL